MKQTEIAEYSLECRFTDSKKFKRTKGSPTRYCKKFREYKGLTYCQKCGFRGETPKK